MKIVRYYYGVLEDKGDGIFYSFDNKSFETFEEAFKFKEEKQLYRREATIFIIQRVAGDGE